MVSYQQLLEQEEMNWIASLHPKYVRPKDDITLDGTGLVTKRPRVLGPKLSARFGVQLSELVNKDGDNKAKRHPGGMVVKRSCENTSEPSKKPRCNGDSLPSQHGAVLNHAASSSSLL